MASDGGAPRPRLISSPGGPVSFPSFPVSPDPPLRPGPCPKGEVCPEECRLHASLMVVPWPLQSQSQERCQSPTMPPRPLPPGLVTLGADALVAPEASNSLTSSVPDTSWGGDPCSAPPFPVARSSVLQSMGTRVGITGLPHVPPTLPTTILHTACSHSTCHPGGDGK